MREIIKNYIGSCHLDMKCILTVPDEYDEYFDRKLYPAIVFLHGAGEQGNRLEDIKKSRNPSLFEEKGSVCDISPQCPNH